MNKFSGKVAIVTGAGSGIGQAIAVELASEGCAVAICARRLQPLLETSEIITSLGAQSMCTALSVTDGEAVRNFVNDVTERFGHVDFLVNNAGITRDNLLIRMSEEEWDEVLATNLKGAFLFSKAVARPMMKQRQGAMVNISSVVGLAGNAGQCNYSASKAGLIAMTQSLAKELASRNVRVNAVAPGFIVSQMTDALPQDARSAMLSQIPAGRFGDVQDIAKAVAFLLSNDASYVTGQTLSVNGGLLM